MPREMTEQRRRQIDEHMTEQRRRQLTDQLTDQRRRVLHLYNQGFSTREMASLLGVSTQRIHQQLKKLELPPPSRRDDPGTGRKPSSP